MKKIYSKADLQVVRMDNDIVTASAPNVTIGGKYDGSKPIDAPGRRSIWD